MIARWVIIGFGVLVVCVGAFVMVQPLGLKEFADLFLTSSGLWIGAALRVVVGVLLWASSGASRTPRTLRVLGALFVLGGLLLPVMGLERLQGIAEWGTGLDPLALRAVGLVAAGLGAFIVWSLWSRRSNA